MDGSANGLDDVLFVMNGQTVIKRDVKNVKHIIRTLEKLDQVVLEQAQWLTSRYRCAQHCDDGVLSMQAKHSKMTQVILEL